MSEEYLYTLKDKLIDSLKACLDYNEKVKSGLPYHRLGQGELKDFILDCINSLDKFSGVGIIDNLKNMTHTGCIEWFSTLLNTFENLQRVASNIQMLELEMLDDVNDLIEFFSCYCVMTEDFYRYQIQHHVTLNNFKYEV